jgi:hypothetical protein
MIDRPVDVSGVRRMMGAQADDMTDDDIRPASAVLAADYNSDGMPKEVAEQARRFAESIKTAHFYR